MAVDLSTLGGAGAQFFDNNGVPLAGGKLYYYAASTTTPKATFTSSSGNVPHTNPIILDSSGRVPSGGEIWLTSGEPYKFVLETPTSILLGTWDNIYGYTTGTADASSEVQTATAGQTLFVLNSMAYNPGTNTLAVYIDGVNQVVNNSYIETNSTSVTFVSGLHEGAVVKFSKINIGATDANVVSYEPGFLGSVATTVADKLQQTVSVKDFGAVGDGVANDTTAIQAAVDAVSGTEKRLFVPAGTYLIEGITINGSVWLDGAGDDVATFLAKPSIGTDNMFYASGVDGITVTNCGFNMQNDVIAGSRANAYLEDIFCFVSCSNVTITHNTFRKAINYTIIFNATALDECQNIYIRDNKFYDGARGGVFLARYGRNVHVTGNYMLDVCNQSLSGISFDKSISLSGVIGAWIEDNYIQQTISGGGAIIVEYDTRQSENVSIRNNEIIGASENGIKVGASVDTKVVGNSVTDCGAHAYYIEGCYDFLLDGNRASGSGGNAVRIYEDAVPTTRNNKNVTVTNNTFHNSNASGATLGVPGASRGSNDSYHIACRSSTYIYIRNNVFIDDGASSAGGIVMEGQQYYIENNNLLELKAGVVTLFNTSTTPGSAYNIVNNAGMQTTATGSATVATGNNFVTVTPSTVTEGTNARILVTPNKVFNGTVAYAFAAISGSGTFDIYLRTAAHANANAAADIPFTWSFSVTDAIGIFGKTTV